MNTETFQHPQRQSVVGVLLIFSQVVYKFLRGFWIVFVFIFFKDSSSQIALYVSISLSILAVFGIIYSYVYYRRFLFHIDYENEEFVLQKGVFSSDELNIPFERIQQVHLKRSILQRVIGVYSLVIDTAGSKDEEIDIKAISKEKATALSAILTKAKNEQFEQENEDITTEKEVPQTKLWTHRVDFLTLLKIGLTKSYLRGFVLMFVFLSTIYNELQSLYKDYFQNVENYSKAYLDSSSQSLAFVLFLFVVVLLLSLVITVGEVFIKYFGLKLQQTPSSLEVEMGLKTNTKVSLQPRRLQRLEISTNPIQKRLNLYEAQFSLASSTDKLDKSKIEVPGLKRDIVERIKTFLYVDEIVENPRQFLPDTVWFTRRCLFSLLPLVGFWVIGNTVFHFYNLQILLVISVIYLTLIVTYHWFSYKAINLKITQDFVIKTHGLWTQKTEIMELYKLQAITVKQPLWYRKKDIYNLTFHTAGGDVSIRAMKREVLKEMNYTLYKIETVRKAWM